MPDAAPFLHHQHCRASADAGAEKSADLARDGRARDACLPPLLARSTVQPVERFWAAELCIPDVAQSAARSCAALVVAAALHSQAEPLRGELRPELLERPAEPLAARVALRDAGVAQPPQELPEQRASPPLEQQADALVQPEERQALPLLEPQRQAGRRASQRVAQLPPASSRWRRAQSEQQAQPRVAPVGGLEAQRPLLFAA